MMFYFSPPNSITYPDHSLSSFLSPIALEYFIFISSQRASGGQGEEEREGESPADPPLPQSPARGSIARPPRS